MLIAAGVMALGVVGCSSGAEPPTTNAAPTGTTVTAVPSPLPSPSPTEPEKFPKRVMKAHVIFHGDVPPEMKGFIRSTFERAGKHFTMRRPKPAFGSGISAAVFSYEATPPPDVCGHAGVTGNIQIFLASDCWAPLTEVQRQSVLVHEAFHSLQHQFLSDAYALPRWLMEGSAEYASFDVLNDWGLIDLATSRAALIAGAAEVSTPLKKMADLKGWSKADPYGRQYNLGALAVERLVKGKGWKPVALFLRDIQTSEVSDWRRSFEKVFGRTIQDFYKEFARTRARGFS